MSSANHHNLLICFLLLLLVVDTSSFTLNPSISTTSSATTCTNTVQQQFRRQPTSTCLNAKTKKKKKRATRNSIGNRTQSASGFGGASIAPCPCGATDDNNNNEKKGYMKCCGLLHSKADRYASATAEEVVRARYSAYAKRQINFIIGSTHPLNKDFMTDIEHWKKQIETNCYDNFELTSCEILEETYEGEGDKEVAKVKFVAKMIQIDSREKTAFMETSTFERAGKHIRGGAWLYKSGEVESVPVDDDDDDNDEDDNDNDEDGASNEPKGSGNE